MNTRRITGAAVAAIVSIVMAACPALAEQASAESPDFTVNTVPEPVGAGVAAVIGYWLFVVRRRRTKASHVRRMSVLGLVMLGCLVAAQRTLAATPVVTNVIAQQQVWPSFLVDITYDVSDADGHTQTISAAISTNSGAHYDLVSTNLAGNIGAGIPVGTNKHITWDAGVDLPSFSSDTVRVRIAADDLFDSSLYMVIDVSAGPAASNYPVSYQSSAPPTNDEYKTVKIVLRRIAAGSFVMGSPTTELGHLVREAQHTVTLSSNFYIGVFEITQAQYSNVTGATPSYYPSASQPVEFVSWNTIRGGTWPGGVPSNSTFMAMLRTRTGLAFDLPTEAQWEYACRAGTTNALNNNTNLVSTDQDPNMDILGRYWYNGGSVSNHTTAGSYLVNNWGLYDMHGNVWEWCLDWYASNYGGDVTDPPGPASGSFRTARGGNWADLAGSCRSANRGIRDPDAVDYTYGFRLSLPAGQ